MTDKNNEQENPTLSRDLKVNLSADVPPCGSPVSAMAELEAQVRDLAKENERLKADKPAVAVPDEWRRIVERAANIMRMSGVVSHKDSLNPLHSWLHDAESLLAAPSHSQQSARSSQDYAIEHAEYMAVNGEQLIDYLNEIANEDDSVLVPDDRFSDYVSGLRSGIYEFRKRRYRCPSHESEQGGEP